MKNFFSNIWFRCIFTLLTIVLISGGLLSVLNDLLYVPEEERTERAIQSIYGDVEDFGVEYDGETSTKVLEYEFGKIEKIYDVQADEENSYILFKATGNQGYKGGTISLWVSVKMSEAGIYSIEKTLLAGFEKQTLMSKLNDAFYGNFNLQDTVETYENSYYFTTNPGESNSNLVSGATMSARAANNAVNCVITYLGENYND